MANEGAFRIQFIKFFIVSTHMCTLTLSWWNRSCFVAIRGLFSSNQLVVIIVIYCTFLLKGIDVDYIVCIPKTLAGISTLAFLALRNTLFRALLGLRCVLVNLCFVHGWKKESRTYWTFLVIYLKYEKQATVLYKIGVQCSEKKNMW